MSVSVNDDVSLSNHLVEEFALEFNGDVGEVAAADFDVGTVVPEFFASAELDSHRTVSFRTVHRPVTKCSFWCVELHRCGLHWPFCSLVVYATQIIVQTEPIVVFPDFLQR